MHWECPECSCSNIDSLLRCTCGYEINGPFAELEKKHECELERQDIETVFPNSERLDKTKWAMKDLVLIVFLTVLLNFVLLNIMPNTLLLSSAYPVSMCFSVLILYFPIFLLNTKYPLKFFPTYGEKKVIKYILIGGIFCMLINFPRGTWTENPSKITIEYYTRFINYTPSGKFLFLLVLCFIGPFTEEILFRGFFYRIIRNKYNVFWGTLISTAVFILIHPLDENAVIYIGIPSLLYTYAYQKTDTILASIFLHVLNNSSWFIFAYWGMQISRAKIALF